MKTITEIKQHFSDNEIKLCVDIIKGKLEFSVLEEQIKERIEACRDYANEYKNQILNKNK